MAVIERVKTSIRLKTPHVENQSEESSCFALAVADAVGTCHRIEYGGNWLRVVFRDQPSRKLPHHRRGFQVLRCDGGDGPVTQEDEKKPMDQGAHINLKVKSQDGNEVFFKIKRITQLKKLMNAYCDRQSVEMNAIAFLFDGRRLRAEQTLMSFQELAGVSKNGPKWNYAGGLEQEAQLVRNWTPPTNKHNGANRSLPPKIQEGLDKQKGEQNHGKEKNVLA
ncbi:small ubiquitin-like modifier 2 [Artemisia annua]|uniref:Small ubiquitin-like modifier 2 n=1 Tax=Artemisia annua TaxID=35608 RepID=A0A2U1PL14_ARTAN|nr:small ubiquitin-like modifier 2 [Artemisia annua]